ncbi:tRNA (adenine(22)-N(1))-methyltransferase TrmK [Evansella sp. AB-rgal1]|uniref:tRNA (adenine(22)-N(1))-methyltransferase n=1 Tax=Evansella sp. AB-rgal1 TaxID=3242696 RepID=UPI00359EA486
MNELQLSRRLEKVASFVKKGSSVADIGSDHAYLPVYLVKHGIVKQAVAGEVNRGPLHAAETQIRKNNLQEQIKAKLGNGLAVIDNENVDTVTIAGMGGPLITKILEEGKHNLDSVQRLILQPNVAAHPIRSWLIEHGWELLDEAIMEEDGHIYEILVAERGNTMASYSHDVEKEIWLGPFLLREKNVSFLLKWQRELEQLRKINQQLHSGTITNELRKKQEEVQKKIQWLEEVFE